MYAVKSLYSTRNWWMFPLDSIADVGAPRSEDRLITFELTQPIRPRYISVTDGYSTDGRLTIAIPCFALNALCGKINRNQKAVQKLGLQIHRNAS